jgi:hypothetical protein
VADADREQRLDPRGNAGGLDHGLPPLQRDGHRCPPSSRTAPASVPGCRASGDVTEPLAAGDPGGVQECGQAQQLGAFGEPGGAQPAGVQPGQAGPARERGHQRGGQVAPRRVSAAGCQCLPGERGGFQQLVLVAGQHRHRPRPGPARHHQDTAGAADDVGAADVAQVGADQPGTRPEADQGGRAHPPPCRGLRVRQGEITVDLRGTVGTLGPLAGQRRVRRRQRRDHAPGQEPQIGAQRPPRRGGQPPARARRTARSSTGATAPPGPGPGRA